MSSSILTLGIAWAVASAGAVLILAGLSFLGGRARPPGAFVFGLFGSLWGVQIIAANLVGLNRTADWAHTLYFVQVALSIPLPFLLVEFALAQGRSSRLWMSMRVATVVTAAVGALILLTAPGLIYGSGPSAPGPLYAILVVIPFYGAFAVALLALAYAMLNSPTPRTASRLKYVLIGVALFLAPLAGKLTISNANAVALRGSAADFLYFALFATLLGLCGWTAVKLWRRARAAPIPAESRAFRTTAWSLALPLGFGIAEGLVSIRVTDDFYTVGLWRLAAVAVIAYGLAQWRIYDLPQRAGNAIAIASGATAAGATATAAYGATTLVTATSTIPVIAGLIVLGAILAPTIRLARSIFGFGGASQRPSNREQELYGQRIDSYRAAVEAAIARGSVIEDDAFLAALRDRFNISDAEDRVLRHYAKSSVLVQRDRHAWEAFERLRLLGEGGGGRTWLARDRARDRLVVLKEPLERWQLEPAAREAVLREARIAAKIRHPNVVTVEEVVEGKGSPVIVMEYLEGGSLLNLIRSRGTLPWRDACGVALDALAGLEAVHAAGIIHHDIKPANILLTADGVPKLADFGIATPINSGKTVIQGASTFAGTYSYVAPEVRDSQSLGDRRSDVYSMAAVLHELLYGAPPARGPVVVRGDIPAAVMKVLAKALSQAPDARHPTARLFAEELQTAMR